MHGRAPDSDAVQLAPDELGPVDYMVVEFPSGESTFSAETANELAWLTEADVIRILDLVIVRKDPDGGVEALEIEEVDGADQIRALEIDLAEILAAEDVVRLAGAMTPGTTAGVLVWENTWAAPLASAVRRAGGQLVATGRIPIQAIVASLEDDEHVEQD